MSPMKSLIMPMLLALVGCANALPAQQVNTDELAWENVKREQLAQARELLPKLKNWLRNGDRKSIAAVVHFPLRVGSLDRPIANRAELLAKFDDTFSPRVVAAVECQDPEDLGVGQYGVAFGRGEIWLSWIDGARELKMYSINNKPWPERAIGSDQECYKAALARAKRGRGGKPEPAPPPR